MQTRIRIALEKGRGKDFNQLRELLTEYGHWKAKPRGVPIIANLRKQNLQSTGVDMYGKKSQQVSDNFDSEIYSI